jgi:hypothetical protein
VAVGVDDDRLAWAAAMRGTATLAPPISAASRA